MNISKIIVNNYRSIKEVEIELENFSIFVGQNNHGKTNFFEAIQWFYNAKSTKEDEFFDRDSDNKVSVEIFFENIQETDITKLSSETNQTKIRNILDNETEFSVKKTSVNHKRSYIVNGEDKGNPLGLDSAMNEFLPKLEYVTTKIRLEDVSKYKARNPIAVMLSDILGTIVEESEEYIQFKEQFSRLFDNDESEVRQKLNELGTEVEVYLKKQFPDGTSVKFMVNQPEFSDLLKSFDTTVDDGIETNAEDKGDGMQRAIMLSIIQAFADYRKRKSGGGTFLFLLDEAELHLHPTAQRALKNALLEISETDQVMLNTHSSVLVADENENQRIFKVEKDNKITSIIQVDKVDKINVIYDLLGGSPSDLLLPRNFIIVEGRSEFIFLKTIIQRFYGNKYDGIKILFARGDLDEQVPSLLAVHKLFVPLAGSENPIYKDKAIVLIDKPNSGQTNKYRLFKEGYTYLFENNQVKELPVESLEEYYPEEFRKTPDEVEEEGIDKVKYAEKVSSEVTKTQFENDMGVLFNTLEKANELSFNPKP